MKRSNPDKHSQNPAGSLTTEVLRLLWKCSMPASSQRNFEPEKSSWDHLWATLPALAEANESLMANETLIRSNPFKWAESGHPLFGEEIPYRDWLTKQLQWCLRQPASTTRPTWLSSDLNPADWKRFSFIMQVVAHSGATAADPEIHKLLLNLWRTRFTIDLAFAVAESARFSKPDTLPDWKETIAEAIMTDYDPRLYYVPYILKRMSHVLRARVIIHLLKHMSGLTAYALAETRSILREEQRIEIVRVIQVALNNPQNSERGNFEYALAVLSSPTKQESDYVNQKDEWGVWHNTHYYLEALARTSPKQAESAIQQLLSLCLEQNGRIRYDERLLRIFIYNALERLGQFAANREVLKSLISHLTPTKNMLSREGGHEWELAQTIGRLSNLADQDTQKWLREELLAQLRAAIALPIQHAVVVNLVETFRHMGAVGASKETLEFFIELLYVRQYDRASEDQIQSQIQVRIQEAICNWGSAVRDDFELKAELQEILSGAGMQKYRKGKHLARLAPLQKMRDLKSDEWEIARAEELGKNLSNGLHIEGVSKPPFMGLVAAAVWVNGYLCPLLMPFVIIQMFLNWQRHDALLPDTVWFHSLGYASALFWVLFYFPFLLGAMSILLWSLPAFWWIFQLAVLYNIKLPVPVYRLLAASYILKEKWQWQIGQTTLRENSNFRVDEWEVTYAAAIALSGLADNGFSTEVRNRITACRSVPLGTPPFPIPFPFSFSGRRLVREWWNENLLPRLPYKLQDILCGLQESNLDKLSTNNFDGSGRIFSSQYHPWQPWLERGVRIFCTPDGKISARMARRG